MSFLQIRPHLLDRSGPQGVLARDKISLHQHRYHNKDITSPVLKISNMCYINEYSIRVYEVLHINIPTISFQTLEVSIALRMSEPPFVKMGCFLHNNVRDSMRVWPVAEIHTMLLGFEVGDLDAV